MDLLELVGVLIKGELAIKHGVFRNGKGSSR